MESFYRSIITCLLFVPFLRANYASPCDVEVNNQCGRPITGYSFNWTKACSSCLGLSFKMLSAPDDSSQKKLFHELFIKNNKYRKYGFWIDVQEMPLNASSDRCGTDRCSFVSYNNGNISLHDGNCTKTHRYICANVVTTSTTVSGVATTDIRKDGTPQSAVDGSTEQLLHSSSLQLRHPEITTVQTPHRHKAPLETSEILLVIAVGLCPLVICCVVYLVILFMRRRRRHPRRKEATEEASSYGKKGPHRGAIQLQSRGLGRPNNIRRFHKLSSLDVRSLFPEKDGHWVNPLDQALNNRLNGFGNSFSKTADGFNRFHQHASKDVRFCRHATRVPEPYPDYNMATNCERTLTRIPPPDYDNH